MLKDIRLKNTYDSDCDNMLQDFYIPALSHSTDYRRLAGFFSSTSLAISARGVAEFVRNGGQMHLICSAQLSKSDLDMMKIAHNSPESIIEHNFIGELRNMEDGFVKDHVRALGWMIANKRLELKIAIVSDDNENPLDEEIIENQGIFHQKIGILEDEEGSKISFSGSANESASGWTKNIEEFKVFRSWIPSENIYLDSDIAKCEKFWNEEALRTRIIDVPLAIREELIRIAPTHLEELNLKKWLGKKMTTSTKKRIILYAHQIEAGANWFKNGNRGIFEWATGVGKTLAALGCYKIVVEIDKKLVTVITCPFDHLVKQWQEKIREFDIKDDIIVADSSNPKWKNKLTDYMLDIKMGTKERLIILTTHATFSSEDFANIIRMAKVKLFLIADEAHGAGAPQRKKGLIEDYDYRLGLSATPRRWFDSEGTDKLFDYFGGTVSKFTLKDAINKINPATGKTYLTPFEYRPIFVELNDEELIEYEKMTKKIARQYHKTKNSPEKGKSLELALFERQKIIKNAHNKYVALGEILKKMDQIKNCLIYCMPDQMETVQDFLNKKHVIQHKFTMEEGTKPEERYNGLSEREYLLKEFAKGIYGALVAMKCLDEGVDIPPARNAIIMASSGNPREHIQRIGRLLRPYTDKDRAIIYDIIVVPTLFSCEEDAELERKILKKEMIRYKYFAYNAINKMECLAIIEKIEDKYGIFVPIGDD